METRETYREMNKEMKTEELQLPTAIPFSEEAEDTRPVVLFVGIWSPFYNSDGMVRGFEDNGYRVEIVDWQKIKYNEGVEAMRERVLAKAWMVKPEFIFMHLQNDFAIDPETADQLSLQSFVINYTFDVREDISWYKEIAPHIGLTLFGDMTSVNQCEKDGIKNVGYLQSSADYSWYRNFGHEFKKMPSVPEIVFIGNNYANSNANFERAKERVEMVEFLQKEYGSKFKVYGTGWENAQFVDPQAEINIYNSAKIAITHNQFYRAGYTSDRIWRSVGCGCLTISQYYIGLNRDFNSSTIGVWLNYDMLKESIDKFLEHEDMRFLIAEQGALHVRHNHSWANRFKEVIDLVHQYQPLNEHSKGGLKKV